MEKGEIALFQQFHLFPKCFPKVFFFFSVLMSIYGGNGLKKNSYFRATCISQSVENVDVAFVKGANERINKLEIINKL